MANLNMGNQTQNQFLVKYLRGTGRTITAAQASANYGIKNLSARMSQLKNAGLRVTTTETKTGKVAYQVSARDVNGSRAAVKV